MPRFVILRHEMPPQSARGLHWDLMLEDGDVLRTWALEQEPQGGAAMDAEALADHRKIYLNYEGTISGNRGTVKRWDAGTYTQQTAPEGEWVVKLNGQRLQTVVKLTQPGDAIQRWRVRFSPD